MTKENEIENRMAEENISEYNFFLITIEVLKEGSCWNINSKNTWNTT